MCTGGRSDLAFDSWSVCSRRLTLAAFFAAALESKPGSGAGGLLRAYAIAIGATTTLVAVLVVLVVVFVLDPILDLTRGARAVGAGDLETEVAVTSTDELGALAESFNEMVSGLRERDGLRGRNAELVDDLRASRERIVASADAERRRLERDLHDGAQQQLVLVQLKLALLERAICGDPDQAIATANDLRTDLGQALQELRDLARGIYPALLQSPPRCARLRNARRYQPSSAVTRPPATRPRSRPPSTSAASRRSRTPPSTPARGPPRPSSSPSATARSDSRSPTTAPGSRPEPPDPARGSRT